MIRVILPYHLRNLARVGREVGVQIAGPATPCAILDALEAEYPMLRGTIRDHATGERRPLLRFFAFGEDVTHDSLDVLLPEEVASGREPFRIVGAIAGG
jgi:molybdopterin synthase sulfur carrier subunit